MVIMFYQHLTPGVVHNFSNAIGLQDLFPNATKDHIISIKIKTSKGQPQEYSSGLLIQ